MESGAETSNMLNSISAMKLAMAKMEPTERSMPPEMMPELLPLMASFA